MYQNPYKANFVVFEGLDGSGKSVRFLEFLKVLKKERTPVAFNSEPTMISPEGRRINRILEGEEESIDLLEFQKLFVKDRKHNIKEFILPCLSNNLVTGLDRYFPSTCAYGFASDIELDILFEINDGILLPDLIFFVDTPAEVTLQRIKKERGTKTFFEKKKYLPEVYKGYKETLERIQETTETKVVFLDGQIDFSKISEQIHNAWKKNR